MGLMERMFGLIFGGGTNVIRDTADVFRENAEHGAARQAAFKGRRCAIWPRVSRCPVKAGLTVLWTG